MFRRVIFIKVIFALALTCFFSWPAFSQSHKRALFKPVPINRFVDQTQMSYPIIVQWQMLRSRAHLSLAGTTTESYFDEWTLTVRGALAHVVTPHSKLDLPWVQSSFDGKSGTLQMNREEFAKTLGIQQELPQDGRLWQAEGPISLIIQPADGRNFEPIFRFVDDNGMILIRLSARVASKP